MLIGQHEGKIDNKSRIALPKRFRDVLGEKIIVTFGYENSLIIVAENTWKTLLSGTEGKPFIQYETRQTQRFLLGGATPMELDNKGRFILPSYLRTFAKIKDGIVFLGLSTYVELWDTEAWSQYQKFLEKNIERISQRLVDQDRKAAGPVADSEESLTRRDETLARREKK